MAKKTIFYLDYFNGMTEDTLRNSKVLRLYYRDKNGKNTFVLSCPYTSDDILSYSIENGWTGVSEGLLAQLQERFSKGIRNVENFIGNVSQVASGAVDFVGNIIGKFSDEAKEAYTNTTQGLKDVLSKGTSFLADSMKEVTMPWDGAQAYTKSTLSVGPSSLSITMDLLSSRSLYEWLSKKTHYTDPSDFYSNNGIKIVNDKAEYLEYKDNASKSGQASIDYSNGAVNNMKNQPVRTYCTYLLNRFGGMVAEPGSDRSSLDTKRVQYTSPIQYDDNSLVLDENDDALDVAKGTFYAVLGDHAYPFYIYNLIPKSIKIVPSPYITVDGDYFYASVNIELDKTRLIMKKLFEQMINPMAVKSVNTSS